MDNYILGADGKTPMRVSSTTWALWFEANHDKKRVANTVLPNGTRISTVFLGLDHSWGNGDVQLFETMVFASADDFADQYCDRYATWQEASDGHHSIVKQVKDGTLPLDD